MATPGNPYIAGKALGQEHGFFGRADILDLVETEMRSQDRNAVVLFGQRRIGKTSITVHVEVYAERNPSHPVVVKVTEAQFTYVAINDDGDYVLTSTGTSLAWAGRWSGPFYSQR